MYGFDRLRADAVRLDERTAETRARIEIELREFVDKDDSLSGGSEGLHGFGQVEGEFFFAYRQLSFVICVQVKGVLADEEHHFN